MTDGLPFSILIVDDDEDDRYLLDEAFKKIGYQQEVRKFITGNDLLAYLEKIDQSLYPSLILLDNSLPIRDAPEIVTTLKKNPDYCDIKIVIHSTMISTGLKARLKEMGVDRFFVKAFGMGELVEFANELKCMVEEKKN